MQIVTAPTPAAPLLSSEDNALMSESHSHAMPEPTGPVWAAIHATTGSFLPVGSVVPVSLFAFGLDGTAQGVHAQLAHERITAEVTAELDAMGIVYAPGEWEPTSGACAFRWAATYGQYICSGSDHHSRDHKAHDSDGKVIASHTADVTVALKPASRKRPTRIRPETAVS
jgi:hypothetical protein